MTNLYDKIAAAYMAMLILETKETKSRHGNLTEYFENKEEQYKIHALMIIEYEKYGTIDVYCNCFPKDTTEFIEDFVLGRDITKYYNRHTIKPIVNAQSGTKSYNYECIKEAANLAFSDSFFN